ncbi:hypothetical protein FACS1894182_05300 [Bacteroidia bacterium]|nr:hypothetical protein FACS1894182_05300 [Bacteroidia bacterium]
MKIVTFSKNLLQKLLPQRIVKFYKKRKPRKLLRFELPVTYHCNLNCKSCGHCCPLAKEHFQDVEALERDFKRLSQLSKRQIELVSLMGGEPLLHPQLIDIMCMARSYFNGKIIIVTNGILLLKQSEEFWKACHGNNIDIEMSFYPINVDVEKIVETAKNYDVSFICRREKSGKQLPWYQANKDVDGRQNISKNFTNCSIANQIITLDKGRLYTCGTPNHYRRFNSYFGDTFEISPKDSIDIYEAKNLKEIMKFLSRPIPFCRYCKHWEAIEWGLSKREMSEWVH